MGSKFRVRVTHPGTGCNSSSFIRVRQAGDTYNCTSLDFKHAAVDVMETVRKVSDCEDEYLVNSFTVKDGVAKIT